jgi:UDP-N-acetylglucosamine 2-epimerase
MKILTVIGNRPQFVKAAAVSRKLRRAHTEVLVHTGQHYDDDLSTIFITELRVPAPEHELRLGDGTNTEQTARMLDALGPLIADEQPDLVLVYGDTNSTLAGALAAAQAGVSVAHVEAGMRSFDRAMPEELNRVLTDHASDLLLCSSQTAVDNLAAERIAAQVELVGDVMIDVALLMRARAQGDDDTLKRAGVKAGRYVLATAHRAGNVDDPARLAALVDVLLGIGTTVVLPLHPRTHERLRAAGLLDTLRGAKHVVLTPPLGYLAFTALLVHSRAVLTDSGGVQKEAYVAGVPCVTLRDSTEWVETVEVGWNVLVDLDRDAARAALDRAVPPEHPPLYGDGNAGERVVEALTAFRSP